MEYNERHGIKPAGIVKAVYDITQRLSAPVPSVAEGRGEYHAGREKTGVPRAELERMINELENQMKQAARSLEFEQAAMLRDRIFELRGLWAEESNLPPWKKARLLAGEDV